MLASAPSRRDFTNASHLAQNHRPHPQHPPTRLDALSEGSQYAMEQHQQPPQTMNGVKHQHSYSNGSGEGMENAEKDSAAKSASSNGQPVRRRISRACDQCNQLRTKCDGKHPCAHCVEFGLTCEYARERKKRGKASRKDIAAQQAAAAAGDGKDSSPRSGNENGSEAASDAPKGVKRRRSSVEFQRPQPPHRTNSMTSQPPHAMHRPGLEPSGGSVTGNAIGETNGLDRIHQRSVPMDHPTPGVGLPTPRVPTAPMHHERSMSVGMGEYGSIDDYHRSILHPASTVTGHNILHSGPTAMPHSMIQGGTITGYGDSPYGVPSPSSQQGAGPPYRMDESPLSAGVFGQSPLAAGSPGWLSLPSPSAALYPPTSNQTLRYPVLRPLLPHISAIIPIGLACDLLELYFSSTSSVFMQPQSPYVLGHIFRKRSFLRQNNPRQCSPALLASILWVAAQTSESAFLTSAPSARGKICQKLLELTVGLLKPLIHTSTDGPQLYAGNTVINGVALGGFGVSLPGQAHDMEGGSPGASGALDDVATYIHLATVVSASEYKGASLRWWNSAWSLARELKLGRELPPNPEPQNPDGPEAEAEATGEAGHLGVLGRGNQPGFVHEEEREERRRIWWLLYIVDRHLALCYNRPLYLLDVECDGLMQPEKEAVWQTGEFFPGENHAESTYFRRRGPSFECTGHSIFGYFLPLMTILGEIVDLNHARNHPRFGLRVRNNAEWDEQANEIRKQLEAYGRSLQDFETRNVTMPEGTKESTNGTDNNNHIDGTSPHSVGTTNSHQQRMTEAHLQTKIVLAYGTHLMHTLHILVNGKWDPISLLDDNDLWISSQSFISATGHAVSAAEAINEILEYDPDLSFMPFFFGIYLLQGSFLLLLIADKLGSEASPSVVKACETIVRAHEACVVTLNTEYQRNFRKVMRSALAQVRGRSAQEDFGEQQLRRREVLALYRWTGDGTGLAL
ncbi:hypothetical protein M409DRAFT_67650 [Zasmidium cellare ATCC 36951]|uniref:Zn(2)-C6 fungal-type domain-containing protein n=1 Tax=Zasmidium cellare ATCC 36951 TaxID=1080233 RepID=A0A6A6CHR3_ZASCE|nr:uncharacterized protein M409DRAFT_67650 [Zasmidium cellare ATCC 36951]KAF2164966.1 hypothetical protein M409DRAFT_67650 [Zasmidium cellare ATCC 36951]